MRAGALAAVFVGLGITVARALDDAPNGLWVTVLIALVVLSGVAVGVLAA